MHLATPEPVRGLNPSAQPRQLSVIWSAIAPLLCAIHCAAAPLLVVAAPGFARIAKLEWPMMGMALALGGWALARGYGVHHRPGPWRVFGLGLVLWVASLLGWLEPLPEEVTTVVGSLVVAASLFWNARLVHRSSCRTCGCPAC